MRLLWWEKKQYSIIWKVYLLSYQWLIIKYNKFQSLYMEVQDKTIIHSMWVTDGQSKSWVCLSITKLWNCLPSEKDEEECIFQYQTQIHAKDNLAKNDIYYYVEWRITQSLDKANFFPRYYFYRLTDKSHYCMFPKEIFKQIQLTFFYFICIFNMNNKLFIYSMIFVKIVQ